MNDGHPADGKEKRFSSLLKLFGRGKRDEDVTEEIMDMVMNRVFLKKMKLR